MKRIMAKLGRAGLVAVTTMAALTTDVRAASTSISAVSGKALPFVNMSCFNTAFGSDKVINSCANNQIWVVPVEVTPSVNLQIFASAAGAGAVVQCRYVWRSAGDGFIAAGNFVTVATDTFLGNIAPNVSSQTAHVDCIIPPGSRGLTGVRWNL
jgi:hypothetical protein